MDETIKNMQALPGGDVPAVQDEALAAMLSECLSCRQTSWSIGEYGAIAEFHHADDAVRVQGLGLVSQGGGVAITGAPDFVLAYETPSGRPGLWMHGIALCMKAAEAPMNGRRVITALGKDEHAIRPADRDTPFFDLGLGLSTVDFCVRPSEAETLRALQEAEGTALLDNPGLFARLKAASPHRALVSRMGRIEVLGSIPSPDQHSPEGPHTHLLPDLLRTRRRFAATLPIAEGWTPALFIHLPNPLYDAKGERRAFDHASHARFQDLLERYGDPAQLSAKRWIFDAVREGRVPDGELPPWTRHERLAARVAVRQLVALGETGPALEAWQAVLDR